MKPLLALAVRRRCLIATCVLAFSLSTARAARAAEPVPMLELSDDLPPPSARTQTLLLGGAVFGGFYGAALAASYGWDEDPGAADLRIPLVGPWLKVGQTTLCANLPESETPCSDPMQVIGGVMAVVSGIGQIGGLALLLEGTFMRTRAKGATASWQPAGLRLVGPAGLGRPTGIATDIRRPPLAALSLVPILTPSTFGAVMTGSF